MKKIRTIRRPIKKKSYNTPFERFRLQANVTPERLADVGKVSTTSIEHYRTGTRIPKLNTARLIRSFLAETIGKKVELDELFPIS